MALPDIRPLEYECCACEYETSCQTLVKCPFAGPILAQAIEKVAVMDDSSFLFTYFGLKIFHILLGFGFFEPVVSYIVSFLP